MSAPDSFIAYDPEHGEFLLSHRSVVVGRFASRAAACIALGELAELEGEHAPDPREVR